MKNLIAFLAFVMMSQAYAQAPQAESIVVQGQQAAAPKKTLIYDERTNRLVEVAPQVQAQAQAPSQVQAEATANAPSASPIYILNNQHLQGYQGTSAVQDAPTTVVQEAPVKVSASATIRKEREGAEAATEDGIVQTLEKARLDDEVRRREKFNQALAPAPVAAAQAQAQAVVIAAPSQAPVAAAQAQAQAVVIAPQAVDEEVPQAPRHSKRKKVVLEDESQGEKVDVKAEVRAAIAEQSSAPSTLTSYYVSGLVGTANYDAANIRSKLSTGFALGMVTPERFVVEGSFVYGQSEIDNVVNPNGGPADGLKYDIAQYNFSAAAKYQILPGKLRPTVGAIASYTHRSYSMSNSNNYGYNYGGTSNQDKGSTDAFDAGLEAGLDLALTNSFSIGADVRYLWNIASKTSSDNGYRNYSYNNQSYQNGGIPVVEDLSYYIASLSAKFTF